MKLVQNFNRTTLAVTEMELVFLHLKVFIFWKHFFNFFYPFHRLQFKWLICYI